MTSLCFDFGNSRRKCGVFCDGIFVRELLLDPAAMMESIRLACAEYAPTHTVLCSVIRHDSAIEQYLSNVTDFLLLGPDTPLPIKNAYERPDTLGMDRIALVTGAWKQFPGQDSLVVAAGSCITYNFINKAGEFLGGGISPGVQMRFRAVHEFTEQLPLVSPETDYPLTGHNTRQSILSGVLNGIVSEADGMISRYREHYPNFNALLTGGDMEFFESRLKNEIFADLFLTYRGLNTILEFNAFRKS